MAPNEREAIQRTPIRPLEKKHLVIKHADLHPQVRFKVQDLLSARKNRTDSTVHSTAFGAISGLALGMSSHALGGSATVGALVPPAALIAEYKLGSPLVRKETERVAEKAKEHGFLDARKTISVKSARETHPFLVVDRKGNVHLIPKTKYQAALAKAQRTFLKHVVPGRYRAKL